MAGHRRLVWAVPHRRRLGRSRRRQLRLPTRDQGARNVRHRVVSRLPGPSRLSPVLGAPLICMPPSYSTIGGFGDKWIYTAGTFVGGPDKRPSSRPDVDAGFRASLDMPTKEG